MRINAWIGLAALAFPGAAAAQGFPDVPAVLEQAADASKGPGGGAGNPCAASESDGCRRALDELASLVLDGVLATIPFEGFNACPMPEPCDPTLDLYAKSSVDANARISVEFLRVMIQTRQFDRAIDRLHWIRDSSTRYSRRPSRSSTDRRRVVPPGTNAYFASTVDGRLLAARQLLDDARRRLGRRRIWEFWKR